jgi:hypothetical protein
MERGDDLVCPAGAVVMKNQHLLFWLAVAIGALTVMSGIMQILWPGIILSALNSGKTPASLHFFGLVGMFMALFGGALLHGLLEPARNKVLIFWAGLQKFGAVAGVGIGVAHGIFSPLALLVAGFDFASAIVIMAYLLSLGHAA